MRGRKSVKQACTKISNIGLGAAELMNRVECSAHDPANPNISLSADHANWTIVNEAANRMTHARSVAMQKAGFW